MKKSLFSVMLVLVLMVSIIPVYGLDSVVMDENISIDYFKSFCNFVTEDTTTITLNAGRCATPNFDEFYLNEPQQ